MPLRAVIVDDEELARAYLREMLHSHPEIELVAECANGFEAVKAVNDLSPDLLFLDVQMPKLDGFEVLELIDADPADVRIGQRVELRIVDLGESGYNIPEFVIK